MAKEGRSGWLFHWLFKWAEQHDAEVSLMPYCSHGSAVIRVTIPPGHHIELNRRACIDAQMHGGTELSERLRQLNEFAANIEVADGEA